MALRDELINIDVEINSNSDKIADNFKDTSETASRPRGEITQLERAMGYPKSAGHPGVAQQPDEGLHGPLPVSVLP